LDTIKRNLVCLGRPLKKTSLELIVSTYDYTRKNRLWRLKTKKAQPAAAPTVAHPLKNQWTALRAARQLAAKRLKIEKSFSLVPLYDEARTYFEENC